MGSVSDVIGEPPASASGPLWEVFRNEAVRLARDFAEASDLGRGTAQEVADFRENAFRALMGRFFPAPHNVAKGQVIGADGGRSASIDCVVLNPMHPHTVDEQGKFRLLLADGVDFVVDVKGRLDGGELDRLLKQCRSVKQRVRSQSAVLLKRGREEVAEAARRIPFYAYCGESSLTPETLAQRIREWAIAESVPPEERPDAIAIHGQGIYLDLSSPASVGRRRIREGTPPEVVAHLSGAQIWQQLDDLTLGAFIVLTTQGIGARPALGEPVITRYATQLTGPSRALGRH